MSLPFCPSDATDTFVRLGVVLSRMNDDAESCGRCSMSTVVDATADGNERDAFGEARIEVDDGEARAVSPAAWLGGVKRRLDELATRVTYGRK